MLVNYKEFFEMEGTKIGRVFNYFEKAGVAAVELSDKIKLGDTVRIVGGDSDFTQIVDSMQIDGKFVESAKAGDRIGIKVCDKVHKGSIAYKVY